LSHDLLDADTLQKYIRLQIEEAVYYLFTWTRGSFFFEAGQAPEEGETLVSLNPESLLLEGARRVDEWSVIEKKIPSLDLIFEVERDRLLGAGVDLTEAQEAVVPLLDGTNTVDELAERTGLAEFDVGQALYGLIQAGFAYRVGRRAGGEAQARNADVEEARNLGIAFYRTAMMDDAAREFRRVLEVAPHDAVARAYLGMVFLRQGRFTEAVHRLRAVLEESGPRYAPYVNLAYALRRLGRTGDALMVLEEAEKLRPDRSEAVLARAGVYLDEGRLDAACEQLDAYRALLDSDALAPATYYHCAVLAAARQGRLKDAEALAEEALGAHPASAPLLLLAGVLAERRGDVGEADRHYRQAAEEDPSLAQCHKNLGDVAYRRGLHDEALEHYNRGVDLAPDLGDDIMARLGNLYYKKMDREQAAHYWRRALDLNPANEVVRNNLEVVEHAG
ncbi:MAG TPA: tetratricopeptide repeat protein, partial [Longimicrobiales bacterium]|nr:tetratricopeptide repeat protein [Longimicrobiales bacterium]